LLQTQGVLTINALNLHLQLLYTPGFWVFVATLIAAPILGLDVAGFGRALLRTWRQFLPGAIAIISFLATAQIMLVSGMTATLGTAVATLGSNYRWLAPWLGALGGWLTGSNAGGNAMFALLQKEASKRAGVPVAWSMAAQNGAGSIATMVAPARAVLATTAANIPGKEGYLLRTLGLLVLTAVGVIMLLLVVIV
jgi:lactate permease